MAPEMHSSYKAQYNPLDPGMLIVCRIPNEMLNNLDFISDQKAACVFYFHSVH